MAKHTHGNNESSRSGVYKDSAVSGHHAKRGNAVSRHHAERDGAISGHGTDAEKRENKLRDAALASFAAAYESHHKKR